MSVNARPTGCVGFGIDDSEGAVSAALWALDDAVRRHTRLRLIHIIDDVFLGGGFADGMAAFRRARPPRSGCRDGTARKRNTIEGAEDRLS